MSLKLFNTETRSVDVFKSIEEKKVSMYTCGPTVYHYAHIGNLRTYVFEDILKRVLMREGYSINHVMNITDVGHLTDDGDDGDDKMEVGASREGKTVWEIAEHYTDAFKNDIERLNIIDPDVWCKATDHIKEQIDMVENLGEKGFTYELEDGLYYDISKFTKYGNMAGLDLEGLQAGSRVEQIEGKRNAPDFCVWKKSPKGTKRLMEWDSPWGKGFPGWHLECSAMALKYLGKHFDIHCGGVDHVRVHHCNEIAQTEAVTGQKWVNWWMHGEFLLLDEGKMSKSADNFLTIDGLVKKGYDPLAFRLYLMSAHYRKALTFTFEALDGSQKALDRLRSKVTQVKSSIEGQTVDKYINAFNEALNDDLNMPVAVSQLWMLLQDEEVSDADKKMTIEDMEKVLQLDLFKDHQVDEDIDEPAILALIEERNKAREEKNYARSDEIRDELTSMGIQLIDGKDGVSFKRIKN
jgi:cysteinyl-tRNA synthetase